MVDPSTHFYELKIDVVKARQYLFSAINKQLTYILKTFWPNMPLDLVVSIKSKFSRLQQRFPYAFVLKHEKFCLFLLLAWATWRVEMTSRITGKPRDRAKKRSFTSLLISNLWLCAWKMFRANFWSYWRLKLMCTVRTLTQCCVLE